MKKVAIISSTYAHSLWSGLGRHTFYLAYSLARRNYDVSVFTFSPGGKTFKSQDGQVSLTRIGITSGEGNSLPIEGLDEWNSKVTVELKKQNFDSILLPTCHGWDSAKEIGCKVIGFVPFVFAFTGWITSVGAVEEQKMLTIEKEFLANCSTLVCHNEQFATRVAQYAYKPIDILPNCHLDLSEDSIIRQQKVPNSILFVGKINKEKSIETAVRALAHVPKATLTLCYPEMAEHYIPKIVKLATQLKIADRIIYKGWLPSAEIKAMYAKSDITVTASFHEPYGYSVLDPMSMGSIPLVSDWSGNAAYVSPEETFSSIESMAQKMNTILDKTSAEKRIMEETNFEKIRTCYSESTVTNHLEEIIRGER